MATPVLRAYKSGSAAFGWPTWSTSLTSGDTLYVVNFFGGTNSITGWTLVTGPDTSNANARFWKRTANGTSTDQGDSIDGYKIGIAIQGDSSIDGVVSFGAQSISNGTYTFTGSQPNNGGASSVSDALFVNLIQSSNFGYYNGYDNSYRPGSILLSNSSSMTSINQERFNENGELLADTDDGVFFYWFGENRAIFKKDLTSSANPGAVTYTNTVSDFLYGNFFQASFLIKSASLAGPIAYGPSIRR